MNRKEWQAIERARDLLGLGEAATLAEIKRAYHRQSKLYHPDTAGHGTTGGMAKLWAGELAAFLPTVPKR